MAFTREPSERDQLADLDVAWETFFGSVRRARGRVARAHEGEALTLSQYVLLLPLLDERAVSTGDLAAQAAVAAPTATRALDALVTRGLVERSPSQTDRRCVVVSLTAEGGRVLRRKRTEIRRKRAAVLRTLEPEEREQARLLLLRLADLMESL